MNFLRFNSHEEMQAYLIQAKADAEQALDPAQRAITFGDYWVRFYDLARGIVEFGQVATLQEVADNAIDYGATAAEAAEEVDDAEARMKAGYLTGRAYSLLNVDGEWGHTHKAHVWPIEESLFNAASETNWSVRAMPTSAKVNFEVAFRAMRSVGMA